MNNMQHGLCMFDADDRLIVCNERYRTMYGLPPELTRPGAHWLDIVAHRLSTLGYRDLELSDVTRQHREMNLSAVETKGTRELLDGRTILVRTRPLKEGGWVGTHEDISERRSVEARLSHMARHDALTGLANRLHFGEKKDQAVAGLARGGQFAILCVDLDRFKQANDALGHAVGDAVLREVAARIRSCLRDTDTAARIGGDEFAILQTDISGPGEPDDLARRLLRELTQPYEIDVHRIHVGASIGIALAPKDETVGPLLLRLADVALYRAKTEGRGTYRFFEPTMDSEVQARRRLELDLRQALNDGALEIYFQPINDALTRTIRGFEALARWRHPELGMISPATFIPVAEQTGLIVPLGEWVLRAACREATRWPPDVRVSVNLSARQFKSGGLTATVRKALSDAGLAPRRLELEITESVVLEGGGGNLAMLHELRDLGVRIAMDDFGTGYSSLSYLRSFPFDKIKIDQSFVRNIDQRDAREIVRAVAGLGRTLGMTTTAEGVETEAQLEAMIAYQCTEVQGYLFSKPVPAVDLPGLLGKFQGMREVA
jgi:diguanylate cyclase (GGDEF)-like protein